MNPPLKISMTTSPLPTPVFDNATQPDLTPAHTNLRDSVGENIYYIPSPAGVSPPVLPPACSTPWNASPNAESSMSMPSSSPLGGS